MTIAYINGEYLTESLACIPVTDLGFLFGEGVFTTIKVENGHPQFLEMHLKKLAQHCQALELKFNEIPKEVFYELIRQNGAEKGIWRLKIIVSSADEKGSETEAKALASTQLITLKPYKGNPPVAKLICYPHPICSPLAKFKTLAYWERLWITDYALKHGFNDALAFDPFGMVLETSVANVFWKQGKEVFFPDPSLSLYHGVTLQVLIGIMESMELKVTAVKVKLEEISLNAQFYLCNSLKGFVPVTSIDANVFKRDENFELELLKAFDNRLLSKPQGD